MKILTVILLLTCSMVAAAQPDDSLTASGRVVLATGLAAMFPTSLPSATPRDLLEAGTIQSPGLGLLYDGSVFFTDELGLELLLAVHMNGFGGSNYAQAVAELYPDRSLIVTRDNIGSVHALIAGPVYRLAWDRFAVEAAMLIGWSEFYISDLMVLSKRNGSNEYVQTEYGEAYAASLFLNPALTLRYHTGENYGLMLRASYGHANYEMDQTWSERTLASQGEIMTVHRSYSYRCPSLGFGVYVIL